MGGLEVEHVYVVGLQAGVAAPAFEPVPDELLREELPPDDEETRRRRAAPGAVRGDRRAPVRGSCWPTRAPAIAAVGRALAAGGGDPGCALGAEWEDREEELFGPAETLHSTYRLLRDELLESTMRAGGRLGELRFDTDLDVSHAVVRYLELLKLAALIARPEGSARGGGAAGRELADPAGGHRRAARDLWVIDAR